MSHTINEAAALVGRARRSIYRAMDEGRLAYSLRHDGRRTVATAELLRVYGPFPAPHCSAALVEQTELAAVIAQAIEPLRLELEQLRLALTQQQTRASDQQPAHTQPPQSFAALLNRIERAQVEHLATLTRIVERFDGA